MEVVTSCYLYYFAVATAKQQYYYKPVSVAFAVDLKCYCCLSSLSWFVAAALGRGSRSFVGLSLFTRLFVAGG